MADVATLPMSGGATQLDQKTVRKAVVACSIGQAFEVFDFLIFGFFAVYIGRNFFPSTDPLASLLASLGAFGAGFLMRPLGAIVLGHLGDKIGRRNTLAISIIMMAIATGITGLLPTYAQIGLLAPVLLVLCRLIQGFSIGGEWGGAATFLAEHSPAGRRGLLGSFLTAAGNLSALVAIMLAGMLNSMLSPEEMLAWGWRIPFLFGCLLGPVAFYLRSKVAETPAFEAALAKKKISSTPLREAMRTYWGVMIVAACIAGLSGMLKYMFSVFLPSYASTTLGVAQSIGLYTSAIGLVVSIVLTPLFGAYSDRIGRKTLLYASAALSLVLAFPLFLYLNQNPTQNGLLVVQIVANVLVAMNIGVITAVLAEMFPTSVRFSALSISYAVSTIVFGGFAPFISTFLVKVTADPLAPAYFMMGTAVISLVATVYTRLRSANEALE
jgi:MHS family proline/betaine transporter-like MFS transporter